MAILAYDRVPLSDQYIDQDGRVHYSGAVISKAIVSPYMGKEIPDYQSLGLDADKIYRLFRDPAEIASGTASFNGLPLMDDHIHVNAASPQKDRIVGTIGTRAEFTAPDLRNDISVWDSAAIEKIKTRKQRELSCAYYYVPVMEPGNDDECGPYDGRMTQIRGNHVALVTEGRVGPGAALDRALNKEANMAKVKTAAQVVKHLTAAIASGKIAADASPEELKKCMDEDMDDTAEDETEEEKAKREAKEAKDKGAKDRKAARDAKAAKDAEEEETEEERKKREDAEKAAEAEKEKASDARVRTAVDAAIAAERARNAEANEARSLVRPLVGEVIGMDSAELIYQYALKEKGVGFDGINIPGLKALVRAQVDQLTVAPRAIAADAAASGDISKRYGVTAPRKL